MAYAFTGLSPAPFQPLFGLADDELKARGVLRYAVDQPVGFPCRVDLADAPLGSTVLLLNFEHQPADTPYRSRHAIFVREGAAAPALYVDEIPPVLQVRPFAALRAFDAEGMMTDASLARSEEIEDHVLRLLADPAVAYLQAHYAARGCYAARIERA